MMGWIVAAALLGGMVLGSAISFLLWRSFTTDVVAAVMSSWADEVKKTQRRVGP